MMLTIDDDIAVQIERLRREREASLKEIVNEALRRGLRKPDAPSKPHRPFRTKTFHGGRQLIPLDNAAEAISLLEGDDHK